MPAKNDLSPNQKQRLIKLLKESGNNYSRGDNKATKHSGAGIKHEAIVEN